MRVQSPGARAPARADWPRGQDAKGKEGEGGGEKQAQRNRIKQMLGLPVKTNSGDEWEEDDDKLEETLQHFNYFAFDGRRGALRWSHKSGDFLPSPFDQEVQAPLPGEWLGETRSCGGAERFVCGR